MSDSLRGRAPLGAARAVFFWLVFIWPLVSCQPPPAPQPVASRRLADPPSDPPRSGPPGADSQTEAASEPAPAPEPDDERGLNGGLEGSPSGGLSDGRGSPPPAALAKNSNSLPGESAGAAALTEKEEKAGALSARLMAASREINKEIFSKFLPEKSGSAIYKVSSRREMEALFLSQGTALIPSLVKEFGAERESHLDLPHYLEAAGLLKGSDVSKDFVLRLPLPSVLAMFESFARENLETLSRKRGFTYPLSRRHSLYLQNFFENEMKPSIKNGRLREHIRKEADHAIMRGVMNSSKRPVPDGNGRAAGDEIYTLGEDENGNKYISGQFSSIHPTDMAVYYTADYPSENDRLAYEESMYGEIIKKLESMRIKAVGVNIWDNHFAQGMIKLANYIRDNKIDVHVLGYCNGPCSNYLLPAAENIYIEQYGLILYEGRFLSLAERTLREWLADLRGRAKSRLQRDIRKMGGAFHFLHYLGERAKDYFLSESDLAADPDFLSRFQEAYDLAAKARAAFSSASHQQAARAVYNRFSPEELESMLDFLVDIDYDFTVYERVLERLAHDAEAEGRFLQKIFPDFSPDGGFSSRGAAQSGVPGPKYSFADFLRLSDHLVRYPYWIVKDFQGLERKFYEAPEREKPMFLIPSAELLKDIGLNIARGENTAQKLPSGGQNDIPERMYMELAGRDIESCGFFNPERQDGYFYPAMMRECLGR